MHCYFKTVKTLVTLLLRNQVLCHLCSVTNTTQSFEKSNFIKSNFSIYRKMLVVQFPYIKITNRRPFMQFSKLMELSEKCMTGSFQFMNFFLSEILVNSSNSTLERHIANFILKQRFDNRKKLSEIYFRPTYICSLPITLYLCCIRVFIVSDHYLNRL